MASDEVPIRPASQDEAAVLRVPGVNMLVDSGTRGTFPSAVAAVDTFIRHSWRSHGLTVRERRMMAFVSDITDKPEWERKVFDDDIVEKWRAEASQTPEALDGDVILSEEMFDFVRCVGASFTWGWRANPLLVYQGAAGQGGDLQEDGPGEHL